MTVNNERSMRSKVYVPIVVLLMICSFYSSTLSESLNSTEEILEPPVISETSEDTQWTTGYECPVEDTELCSTAIDAGTTHNDWLELLRSTGETWVLAAPNSGGALTNLDAAMVRSGDETLLTTYLDVREHHKAMLDDFYSSNDVANMSVFEIQQASALSFAEFSGAGTDNVLHDEVLALISGLLDIVRSADPNSDVQSQFEDELNSILDGSDIDDVSAEAQQALVLMHAVYHASDWYWENEDLERGPGWKKVLGDALGIVAGAALTIGSGGADMGIGVTLAAAATGSLFGDDSGGQSGGFTGDITCNPADLSECVELLSWSEGYNCPDVASSELCTEAIIVGTGHNELLELLRSTGDTWPHGATTSDGAIANLDAAMLQAICCLKLIGMIMVTLSDDPSSDAGLDILEIYDSVRPHQKAMLDDFYSSNDVANMSVFEIQQASALSFAEFSGAGTDNVLHDEVLALISGLLDIVRSADPNSDVQSQFEDELNRIIAGDDFSSASVDAQRTLILMHAVYHASDWYWENEDLERGPGWKKVLGDALGIVAGAALTIGSGGADMGIGVTLAAAATGSLFGDDSGGQSGLTDPLVCDDDNWVGCAIVNIGLSGVDSASINRFDIPDDWSLTDYNPESSVSFNGSEEKSAFGLYHNANGWHFYYWESPVTCNDIDNAQEAWANMGTDNYMCWDMGTGGALVMFANQADEVDISIGFATPQGNISYTAGDLIDLGYLSEGKFVRDVDAATSVLESTKQSADDCEESKSGEKLCFVYGSLNGVSFTLTFANLQCSDLTTWMTNQENTYGNSLVWGNPACQNYSDIYGGAWCEVTGYFAISVDSDDLTDKSGEEDNTEDGRSIPGFTLLPLLAALGAAMLFSRKKHLGN